MAIRHNHLWERVGYTSMGDHHKCAECNMHRVRLMGGYGYKVEGDLTPGFWDNETAAALWALRRLGEVVPMEPERPARPLGSLQRFDERRA